MTPELVIDAPNYSMYIELRGSRAYLHINIKKWSVGCMKSMADAAVFLAERFGGELWAYCPTPQIERIAMLALFERTGTVASSWTSQSQFFPEYKLCLTH